MFVLFRVFLFFFCFVFSFFFLFFFLSFFLIENFYFPHSKNGCKICNTVDSLNEGFQQVNVQNFENFHILQH